MKNCLVVDDSRVIRKVACDILHTLDFETQEAEDAIGALSACGTKMPDVILLDLQLPNMTSVEFLRGLRRKEGGSRPFVVLCTTENDLARLSEALNAGADEYLMKPFDRKTLGLKLSRFAAA